MTLRSAPVGAAIILATTTVAAFAQAPYPVPDTRQSTCYDTDVVIDCPAPGDAFYGQDAQHQGPVPSYTANGDGTVRDDVTGLMWLQSPDLNGDGDINVADKLSYGHAMAMADQLSFAGYDDWRVPTITELYSLIDFNGMMPPENKGTDTAGLVPFIDTTYFAFGFGDTDAGERVIDAQMVSSTVYVSGTMRRNDPTVFGVNFADGRIKGYGMHPRGDDKLFYVMLVRGDTGYSVPAFTDNGDGTVTDASTGLMWEQADSGAAMSWQDALSRAERLNAEDHLGHADWRLPNVKELQGLVDYTRAPDTTGSAALDPVFAISAIINEAGQVDYPYFWSATTHANFTRFPGRYASYVSFGRAMGYMNGWTDVHGAGAQRSDPKLGDPADYPEGHGPQGDAIRILNHVRLVRDAD